MKTLTRELRDAITPDSALDLLKAGNRRFINNLQADRNLLQQASATSRGQYPFATILSCIDSRTSAEIIFDQGLGDIFSVRIAGNIINDDILGSMEYACKVAGSRIIVVLGHSNCGAIKSACDSVEMGNLTALLAKIRPAVEAEKSVLENRDSGNDEFVEKVALLNVERTMQGIEQGSSILKDMLENNKILLVGGMHDIATGEVTFFRFNRKNQGSSPP